MADPLGTTLGYPREDYFGVTLGGSTYPPFCSGTYASSSGNPNSNLPFHQRISSLNIPNLKFD
jgi:hypothetical protein